MVAPSFVWPSNNAMFRYADTGAVPVQQHRACEDTH